MKESILKLRDQEKNEDPQESVKARQGGSVRQKLISRLNQEVKDIEEEKRNIDPERRLPDNVELPKEFKLAHKPTTLTSNPQDFEKEHLMKQLMVSRYNHEKYDADLLMP